MTNKTEAELLQHWIAADKSWRDDKGEALAIDLQTALDRIAQLEAERDIALVERDGANERVQIVLKHKDNWKDRAVAAEAQLAQRQAPADGWVMVPREFVAGFNTLAHNYSLTVIPPDRYWGTERDAFRNAYAQCGADLAELKAMLAASPTPPQREALTDEQIEAAIHRAVKSGVLSWTGFKKDDFGAYTVPILSPVVYKVARAIEAAHGIKGEEDGK